MCQRLPLSKMTITDSMVSSVKTLLTPMSTGSSTSSPLFQQLPIYGTDAGSIANQICRVVAEMKTRSVVLGLNAALEPRCYINVVLGLNAAVE